MQMSELLEHKPIHFQGAPEECPIHPPIRRIVGDPGNKLTPEQTITERSLFVNRMLVDAQRAWYRDPKTGAVALYKVIEGDQGLYLANKSRIVPYATKNESVISEIDADIAQRIEMVIVDPVAAWGSRGSLLMTHTGREPVFASYDLPDDLRSQVIATDRNIQCAMMDYAEDTYGVRTVSTGVNFGAAGIFNVGLQTMLHYHKQDFIPGPNAHSYTHADILQIRDKQPWDGMLSRRYAEQMKNEIETSIGGYDSTLRVQPDAMGFTVALPGFTPQEYDEHFVMNCFRPMALTIHEHLRATYGTLWGQHGERNLNDIIWYLYNAQFNGFDRSMYDSFFPNLHEKNTELDDLHQQIRSLARQQNENGDSLLRKPPGWAFMMNYQDEGALITATFGFLNTNVGPVEGGGVSLSRPKRALTQEERQHITTFNNRILDYACGSNLEPQVRL